MYPHIIKSYKISKPIQFSQPNIFSNCLHTLSYKIHMIKSYENLQSWSRLISYLLFLNSCFPWSIQNHTTLVCLLLPVAPFLICFYFLKILFIWERERTYRREHKQGRVAEGECEAVPPLNRKPNVRLSVGLNPRTLESWPNLKSDA